MQQFLASQPGTGSQRLHWVPLHAEASSDGTFGVTYGVTGISSRAPDGDSSIRFGKYLSAWVRSPAGWRLVAHAQLYLVDPSGVTVPPGFVAPTPPPPDWARASTAFASTPSRSSRFIVREHAAGRFKTSFRSLDGTQALLHTHCHQKAFGVVPAVQQALALVPALTVQHVESGCCGMAGSFGMEAEHVDTSLAMAELALLPAVRAADAGTLIVADGTSCRHQIHDGAQRRALHVAQVMATALAQ